MFTRIISLSLSPILFASYFSYFSFNNSNSVLAQTVERVETVENEAVELNEVRVNYRITNRYDNMYRIEVDIVGLDNAKNWQGSFYLPAGHELIENYGILVTQDEAKQGGYNFIGDEWNSSLQQNDRTKAILIVEGNPKQAAIAFDNYVEEYGVPKYSSFTQADRQQWLEEWRKRKYSLDLNQVDESEVTTTEEGNGNTDEEQVEESKINSYNLSTQEETEETYNDAGESEVSTNIDTIESNYINTGNSAGKGKFRYGEVLQKNWLFFMANRSGPVGSDNRLEWRQDSTMKDGIDVGKDLTGGYFDAGDHIKFIQPMAFSIAMLAWSGVDYNEAYKKAGQLDELLSAVKWGTDYFLKSHETSDGKTSRLWVQVGDAADHNHWIPPEKIADMAPRPSFAIDPNNPGTDAAAGTASALASASMLFRGIDDLYADKLLKNAKQLFEFAETYKGKYSDSVSAVNPFYTSWSGYEDELILGAAWLYRATGDAKYLTKAEQYFKQGVGHIGTWTYASDDHSYAGLALLAKESSDPFFKTEFADWMKNWLIGTGGVKITQGKLAIRNEWSSAPLALSAAFLAEWYNDFVEPNKEYASFAKEQLDYILGDNPRNYSYVVGFGNNYPQRSHHRGSAGLVSMNDKTTPNENLLVGALVGGPRSNDNDHYDRRDDWVTNEVGTGYNAPLAGTAIQQYDNYGGDPLSDAELTEIEGVGQ